MSFGGYSLVLGWWCGKMTINNAQLYVDGLWDWSILKGCFGGTRIAPTDIDGAIERNGRVLLIETKQPGVPIPDGQRWFFDAFIAAGFSVLYVWGKKGQPERLKIVTPKGFREYEEADLNKLREVVSEWFEWADKNPVRKQF